MLKGERVVTLGNLLEPQFPVIAMVLNGKKNIRRRLSTWPPNIADKLKHIVHGKHSINIYKHSDP